MLTVAVVLFDTPLYEPCYVWSICVTTTSNFQPFSSAAVIITRNRYTTQPYDTSHVKKVNDNVIGKPIHPMRYPFPQIAVHI